jgi:hypothetical protein
LPGAARASLLALSLLTGAAGLVPPAVSRAQVFVDVRVGLPPPPLPIYAQPPLPGPDYIWTPGYWAWDASAQDYYWTPGAWVLAPRPGYLWTPSYWGWDSGVYVFHGGYWGPHVGFYGGVNYGFGYTGVGFVGGYWGGGHYFYNRAVNNVSNVRITTVYNTPVADRANVTRVSYSGGPGGVNARPTPEQAAAALESHIPPTATQTHIVEAARTNRAAFASANHGVPPVAARARPPAPVHVGEVSREEAKPAAAHAQAPVHGAQGLREEARPAAAHAQAPRPSAQHQQAPRPRPAPQSPHPSPHPAAHAEPRHEGRG